LWQLVRTESVSAGVSVSTRSAMLQFAKRNGVGDGETLTYSKCTSVVPEPARFVFVTLTTLNTPGLSSDERWIG
jgi:hypothetical protein